MTLSSKAAIVLMVLLTGALNTAFAAKPEPGYAIHFDGLGQSEILAWRWGVSQSGSFHVGGGGGAGKGNFQDLSITKPSDQLTALPLEMVASGHHMESVVLKAGEQVIEMRRVMITSISMGGAESEKVPSENITLNFAEFCYRRPIGESCWNIATNSP